MTKNELRKNIISACESLDSIYREKAHEAVLHFLMPILYNADSVAIYRAYGWEFNLDNLINYCQCQSKHIFQPVAYKKHKNMYFISYEEQNKVIFYNDIQHQDIVQWYNLDLIFLPLVAIDRAGHRLGKGGGYYDTTLCNISNHNKAPILCGIGYACQLVEAVAYEKWDIKLDYFACESGLIKF